MRFGILFILLSAISGTASAWNESRCSSYLNDGLFKKYEYQGVDNPVSKASKKLGSSKGSSALSTEGSTAWLDPKHWTHTTSSAWQAISSWGPCATFGFDKIREQREKYFVQNKDEVLKEIARGQGEHLDVLASYSLCDDRAFEKFATSLQGHTADFLKVQERQQFGDIIDSSVRQDGDLATACYSFPT